MEAATVDEGSKKASLTEAMAAFQPGPFPF